MPNNDLIPRARRNPLASGETSELYVSGSPHIRAEHSTRGIMADVLIALVPALIISVFFYGFRTLSLVLTSTAACIAFEWLYERLMKKPNTTHDLSAAVTGVLLAFSLPASVPYWLPVVGAAFAILIVKQLYGGIGKNFLNPALAAKAFLLLCYPDLMSAWTEPFSYLPLLGAVAGDGSITPLMSLSEGLLPAEGWFSLLLGRNAGCLGDGCALVLLLGGVYLCLRRVISPRIPLVFLSTVALLAFAFPLGGANRVEWMLAQLLSGSLVLAAVFMATDCTTTPTSRPGQTVFAFGCGVLTVLLRYFGAGTESVCFAVLAMNLTTRPLDALKLIRRKGGAANE